MSSAASPAAAASSTSQAATPSVDRFHDLLVTAEDCVRPSAQSIARSDALVDLETAEQVLRRGYAGFELARSQGFDWESLFTTMRAELAAMPDPIVVEEFRLWLVSKLRATRDGHLAVYAIRGERGGWQYDGAGVHEDAYTADLVLGAQPPKPMAVVAAANAALVGSKLLDCASFALADLLRPTVVRQPFGPAWRLVLLSASEPKPLQCTFQARTGAKATQIVPLRRLSVGQPSDPNGPVTMEKGELAHVRIGSFSDAQYADALGVIVSYVDRLRSSKAIVVDLRGNGGGNDNHARNWFKGLTSGTLSYSSITELESDATLQGSVNARTCGSARVHPGSSAEQLAQAKLLAARGELEVASTDAARPSRRMREWPRHELEDQGSAPRPYRGALILLVDRKCASACESFIRYARQLPRTWLLGENTAGVGRIGEVKPYRLPHSGLWLQAGTKLFGDTGRARGAAEGTGYLPDLWIDGTDTASFADQLAQCLSGPLCSTRFPQPSSAPILSGPR